MLKYVQRRDIFLFNRSSLIFQHGELHALHLVYNFKTPANMQETKEVITLNSESWACNWKQEVLDDHFKVPCYCRFSLLVQQQYYCVIICLGMWECIWIKLSKKKNCLCSSSVKILIASVKKDLVVMCCSGEKSFLVDSVLLTSLWLAVSQAGLDRLSLWSEEKWREVVLICGEGSRLRTANTLTAPINDSSLASSLQAQP